MRAQLRKWAWATAGAAGLVAALAPVAPAGAAPAVRPAFGFPIGSGFYRVEGTVYLSGFANPSGFVSGGTGTDDTQCVLGNDGYPFTERTDLGPKVAITARIAVDNWLGCEWRATRSYWHLDISTPAKDKGQITFFLGQSGYSEPYEMKCLGSSGAVKCLDIGSPLVKKIEVEPR